MVIGGVMKHGRRNVTRQQLDPLKIGRQVGEDAVYSLRYPPIKPEVNVIRIDDYISDATHDPECECTKSCGGVV